MPSASFASIFVAALLCLPSTSTAAPSSSSQPNTQPVTRGTLKRLKRTTETIDETWLKGHRTYVKGKYNTGSQSTSPAKRQSYGSSQLFNYGADYAYFTSVSIGTPAVNYDVLLDTGSSDLWFVGSDCPTCAASGRPTYSSTGSSTFNTTGSAGFGISYLGGDVNGTTAHETVTMAGMPIQNQVFGVIHTFQEGSLPQIVSGLIGMAWRPLAKLGVPWWMNAATTYQWAEPLFAVALSREGNNPTATATEPGGSFTIGAVDSSLFTGDIEYVSIPNGQSTWWLIPMTGITIGGSTLQIGSQLAAIDTGTTLIGGPPSVVAAIYAQIPGSQASTGDSAGYYYYPCTTQVNIGLTFGNKTFAINPNDFPYDQSNGMCLGAIFAVQLGSPGTLAPQWIIGDAFLKNVYSVFRYYPPAVGFAQLSNPAALLQTQPPLTAPVVSTAIPTNVLTLGGSQSLVGVTVTSVEPFATGARSTTGNGNSAINFSTPPPPSLALDLFAPNMVSGSAKSPVHTREHRERGQLLERQKLGILEKKKDYVVRAKNYHTKRLRIERLQEKAKERNKDEFYYAMKNQKTDRGVHVSYRENQSLTTEIAKVLKAQDANYIRTMKRANLKRIAALKSQLMILADLVQTNSKVEEDDDDLMDDVGAKDDDALGESGSESDENESDDSEKREKRKEKEALKIRVDVDTPLSEKDLEVLRGAGILARSSSTAGPSGQQGSMNGHIVFVDDEDSAWGYQPPKAGSSSKRKPVEIEDEAEVDLGWITPVDSKRKGKQRAAEPEDALDPYAKARGRKQRTKLLKELAARLERDKHLRYAQQELEMQRLTMAGKGSHRKIKEKEQLFDEPDEQEAEEFTFRRKNRMPVVELGNEVYKPKVFKWRQERKR
ncbi:hypothetical protein FRC05_007448 [Tulasnella sp. 425]|nr:hypothetical protein FRC05_007448 [Tulasnella sp. 425]